MAIHCRYLMAAIVLAACALPAGAQDEDSDKAKSLLNDGIALYNKLDFKKAQPLLLKVDKDYRQYLTKADKDKLDDHLSKSYTAIRKQDEAMAAHKLAGKALKADDLAKAKELFAKAAASEYMQPAMRKEARARLAEVEAKIKAAATAKLAKAAPQKTPATSNDKAIVLTPKTPTAKTLPAKVEPGAPTTKDAALPPAGIVVKDVRAEGDTSQEPKAVAKAAPEEEPKVVAKAAPEEEPKTVAKTAPEEEPKAVAKAAPEEEPKTVAKAAPEEEPKTVAKTAPEEEPKAVAKAAPEEEPKAVAKTAPKTEPKPFAKVTPTPKTVPTTTPGTSQTTTPGTSPTNEEAERMLANIQARQKDARKYLQQGRVAMDNNQKEKAAAYFAQARALAPDLVEAQQGLDEARDRTITSGAPDSLTPLEQKRRIRRQKANIEYDKAKARAYELVTRPDRGDEDFSAAEQASRFARNVLVTNKSLYDAREYDEKLAEIEDQLKYISGQRDDWHRKLAAKERQEIARNETERRRKVREQRTRQISDLRDRSRVLRAEHRYAEARKVVKSILLLDPTNKWAAEWDEHLAELVLVREERLIDRTRQEQEQHALVDVRVAEIPWWETITYPKDWKEKSESRLAQKSRADESPENRRIYRALRQKVSVDFAGIGFDDVVDHMRSTSKTSIYVNRNALEAAGIELTSPVTVQVEDVTFEKVLRMVLTDVGGLTQLGFVVDEGVIEVSTKEDLAQKTITEVYDISDLIIRIPNFGTDTDTIGDTDTSDDSFTSSQDSGDSSEEEDSLSKGELIGEIVTLIADTVDPLSWRTIGEETGEGEVGVIRELHGQLVVTQTPENQDAIRKLLADLRKTKAIQINIEARFISVSTGFLNSIGLDLDFYFNLGSNLGALSVVDPVTGAIVPTTDGLSGWNVAGNPPGNNRFPPMGVVQNHGNAGSFADMIGVSSSMGSSIGGAITSDAMSLGGTFLDDIQVDFLIRATQAHETSRSLAAPRITLSNGQRAFVYVGQRQSYVSDLTPVIEDNAVSYDPQPTEILSGTTLNVEATVSADRRYVTLTVEPSVTTLNGFSRYATTVTGTDPSGNPILGEGFIQLPNVTEQRLATTVTVPDGGTLLLGGQKLAGEIEREMGVPLLNKIPIINRLFTNRGMIRDEQTLLILIKPTIIIQHEEEEKQFP